MTEALEVGLLFPGQGSQFVGMGRDLAERFSAARAVFEVADDALGFALSELCWNGPETELTRTHNAQPAILTHSLAVWAVLRAERPASARIGAGHSLGEFSAYAAAGSLDFPDAIRIVRRRGELMLDSGEARPGTMAALLGLEDEAVERVCREASSPESVVVPANFNAPGQVVISGDVAAVERAVVVAREAGAKRAVPLNVSGAFHSPLMAVAAEGLRAALASAELRPPTFPVVSNVSATPVSDPAEARRLLVDQLTAPVRWVASVQEMAGVGVGSFLELGPGNVLGGLAKRIDRAVSVRSLGSANEVETFLREEGDGWS